MNRSRTLATMLAAATGPCLAAPAMAQDIPIVIGWTAVQPESVQVQGPSGTRRFDYVAARKQFEGKITAPSRAFERRTLFIKYNGRTFPLTINIRPGMDPISFTVARDDVPSCANIYVGRVEQKPTNMDDAMRLMLTAEWMLSNPGPDDNCTGPLLTRAQRAHVDRAANLASLSEGLFGVADQFRNALAAAPGLEASEQARLTAVADRYDADSAGLMAKTVYAAAKLNGDATQAATMIAGLRDAAREDPILQRGLALQSIPTGTRLAPDLDYLQGVASIQATQQP